MKRPCSTACLGSERRRPLQQAPHSSAAMCPKKQPCCAGQLAVAGSVRQGCGTNAHDGEGGGLGGKGGGGCGLGGAGPGGGGWVHSMNPALGYRGWQAMPMSLRVQQGRHACGCCRAGGRVHRQAGKCMLSCAHNYRTSGGAECKPAQHDLLAMAHPRETPGWQHTWLAHRPARLLVCSPVRILWYALS